MKPHIKVLVFSCIGFLFFTCNKDSEVEPSDFRNEYAGSYLCTYSYHCYGPCDSCRGKRDTLIEVVKSTDSESIEAFGMRLLQDSSGTFEALGMHGNFVNIRNDTLRAHFRRGEIVCGSLHTYRGIKILEID